MGHAFLFCPLSHGTPFLGLSQIIIPASQIPFSMAISPHPQELATPRYMCFLEELPKPHISWVPVSWLHAVAVEPMRSAESTWSISWLCHSLAKTFGVTSELIGLWLSLLDEG